MDATSDITIRRLETQEDYRACVALQKATWGDAFTECVPPSMLMVSQKIGGVAAGAFDAAGRLVGFVFGLTGVKDGRLVHWSDMLAVTPALRDRGLGRRLKIFQRESVRALGVEVIYWTFDPLVARNAHLNLNRLGARVTEYVPDMYAADSPRELYRGLSMDRFVVAWEISQQQSPELPAETSHLFEQAPVVNTRLDQTGAPALHVEELPLLSAVRVEIPNDINFVKAQSLETAIAWRETTRRAFLFYLEQGYRVAGFYREVGSDRCFYGISKE